MMPLMPSLPVLHLSSPPGVGCLAEMLLTQDAPLSSQICPVPLSHSLEGIPRPRQLCTEVQRAICGNATRTRVMFFEGK